MNRKTFLRAYLAAMLPTYVLTVLGSTVAPQQLMDGTSPVSSIGLAFTALHAGLHIVCVLIGRARGRVNGDTFLFLLPVVAGVISLVPPFSSLALVPSVLHLIALFRGSAARYESPFEEDQPPGGGQA